MPALVFELVVASTCILLVKIRIEEANTAVLQGHRQPWNYQVTNESESRASLFTDSADNCDHLLLVEVLSLVLGYT